MHIRMLAEDEQFIGEGTDSLDKIKFNFRDVLCFPSGKQLAA